MYRGQRDAHLVIKVPQTLCYEIKNASGIWVEVFVPPLNLDLAFERWKSFVVPPEQVFWYDKWYNAIESINAHTRIRCCEHITDSIGLRQIIPETDVYLDPYDIIQHIEHYIYKTS